MKRNSGFTLVELVSSAAIFVVVGSALAGSLLAGLNSNSTVREHDQARYAARSQMEQILATEDFSTIVGTFDGVEFPVTGLVGPGRAPAGLVTIDATNPALLGVIVTVTWVRANNGTDTFELRTSLADVKP